MNDIANATDSPPNGDDLAAGEESALVAEGWAARARGDFAAAESIADALRARFGESESGYQIGALVARDARRFDLWSRIMDTAKIRFAAESWPLVEAGWAARARGDAPEAGRVARDLRARFPDLGAGYQIGALAARDLGDVDEAAALIAEASPRFPGEAWLWEDAGWAARASRDFARARDIAANVRAANPGAPFGYQLGCAAARDLGDHDESDQIALAARERFPSEAWPLEEAGWTALTRPNHAAAIWLGGELRRRFPGLPSGYQIGFDVALATGEFEEAGRLAGLSIRRFPGETWASERADLARSRLGANARAMDAPPPAASALDVEQNEYFVAYLKGRDTLLVWFGGINEPFFSAEFAHGNAYDCLYFRDGAYDWYTNGARDLFSSAAALRDWLARFRGRYAYAVAAGQSSGGYAALYYGKLCHFDLCIAFSPQIHNTFDGPGRMSPHVRIPDLREVYAEAGKNPRVILNVGRSEDNHAHQFEWKDLEQIKEFKTLDCVTLMIHPYDTHTVSIEMRRRGELYRFIDAMIALHCPRF